jgi:antitoxin component YwqK of YwqJK toxin-antitoxin module
MKKKNGIVITYFDKEKTKIKMKSNYVEDKFEGEYIEYYDNGVVMEERNYLYGKTNGVCKEYKRNGKLYIESTYKNGKKEGNYKEYNDNGEVVKECNYLNDKLEGKYEETIENGYSKIECNYVNGLKEGEYKKYSSYNSNGVIVKKCNYVNDKLEGNYKLYRGGNVSLESNYMEDKLEGDYKEYYCIEEVKGSGDYKTFIKEEGKYVNFKKDGLWKKYDNNGVLEQIIPWENGKINGFVRKYWDGILEMEEYYDNYSRKTNKSYYKNGNIKTEDEYGKDGFKIVGISKKYLENGVLKEEHNQKTDECIEYYESGNKKMEFNRKNYIRNGLYKEYYENGNIKEVGSFAISKKFNDCYKVGVINFYNENGVLEESKTYEVPSSSNMINFLLYRKDYLN